MPSRIGKLSNYLSGRLRPALSSAEQFHQLLMTGGSSGSLSFDLYLGLESINHLRTFIIIARMSIGRRVASSQASKMSMAQI